MSSDFGYFRTFARSGTSDTALALQTQETPQALTFSNGNNVWRIRMEADNNLTFAFSSDAGLTFAVKHIFTNT